MLQHIDRELIELLGKRIAFLREAKLKDYSENTIDVAQLLSQSGVPEFVWQHLSLSCAAASTIASPSKSIQSRRVTIIGGRGKMGSFFAQELSTAGHQVNILEQDDWDKAAQLLGVDLVLVCVPIECTLQAIERAAPYLNPSTALVDITSLKTTVVPAMLKHHPGPVVSLHPMFGPSVRSFLSQNVIVCPGRQLEACQWFLDAVASRGGKLVFCTPQEHDRMMVAVQAIRHFTTFSLGVFLAEEGIDCDRSLQFTTSLYRLQLNTVSRLFSQNGSLYLSLMLSDEERRQAISRLASTFHRLAQLIVQKEQAALTEEFETAQCYFQQYLGSSLPESDYMINSLSVFLAASESKKQSDTSEQNLAA
jgi:prephenate dehydrogenase/chorismate mutase/prephenate dehydrogenase